MQKYNNDNLFLLIVFIVLSVSACLPQVVPSNPPPPLASAPNWYTEPPLDSEQYWVGVGAASVASRAEKQALSSISHRINTTIASSIKQRITSSTDSQGEERVNRYARQELAAKTDEITFRAYSVEQNKRVGNKNYILVKVDKNKFFQNYSTRLDSLNQELDNLSTHIATQPVVVQLKGVQEITQKVTEAEKLAIVLDAYDHLPEADRYFSHYTDLKGKEAQLRSRIKFYIEHDRNTRLVAKHFKEQVNKENFRVATGVYPNDRNVAHVSIQGETRESKFGEAFIIKLIVTLKVRATNRQIISTKQLVFSGSSVTDFQLSLRAASNAFADHVQEYGVLKTLGLISE